MIARAQSGTVTLPPGVTLLDLTITGSAGSVLRLAPGFTGRAAISGAKVRDICITRLTIEGDPSFLSTRQELIPPENAFRVHYTRNGILLDQAEGVEISDVALRYIPSFAVLISRSSRLVVASVSVEDSGTLNAKGRNNTTGGILLEDGVRDFEIRNCFVRNVRGNGVWTHSQRTAARSTDGRIVSNHFDTLARDAIQVGHATRVRVERNTGTHIGFPAEIVDNEAEATPVAVDTAGNVDHSVYAENLFEELNGKCFDLDGFHHGEVRANRCRNAKDGDAYPNGHFGIVLNNNDPGMQSQAIRILDNEIVKPKLGGLFLMGSGHEVRDNRFLDVNTMRCPDSGGLCNYVPSEPKMLASGIYLSPGVSRKEHTRDNVIRGNTITGHRMAANCIAAGPGVSLAANRISQNVCTDRRQR
jgi:hypothetical protein